MLMGKPDAATKLLGAYDEIKQSTKSNTALDEFKLTSLQVLMGQVQVSNENTKDEPETVKSESATTAAVASSTSTVYTPNGTAVSVLIRGEELTLAQRTSINNQFISAYPNATFISTSTTNFNCHSYAWHLETILNAAWMDNPSAYMTDGSYTRFTGVSAPDKCPGFAQVA